MAKLELVTVRARTRGKGPQEFSYQGVGKIVARKVLDKDGVVIKRADGTEVEIDDIDADGLTDNLNDVIELFGTVASEVTPIQRIIDGALMNFNLLNRKAASPVTEAVTEDELTPYIDAMISAGVLEADKVAVWRRNLTTACKMFDWEKIEGMKGTKEYKALVKAGKLPTVPATV